MGRQVVTKNDMALIAVNDEERKEREWVETIKRSYAKDCDDAEFALFIQTSKRTGLDPLARQIYAVKRYDSRQGRDVMAIQISIDGFRVIAERSGKYGGQKGPEWCGKDGVWSDIWMPRENEPFPYAARVGIIRKDFLEPLYAVAVFKNYCATDSKGNLTPIWQRMPDLMIAKCAESLALRRAFPAELSGLYTVNEMDHDNAAKGVKIEVEGATEAEFTEAPDYSSTTRTKADDAAREWFIKQVQELGIKNMKQLIELLGVKELPTDVTFGEILNQVRAKQETK